MRIGSHDQGERFAVAELVVAPALKPTKDRVKAFVGVFFQMPEDGDVAGVTNFFRQVGGVKNVFGLEVGVGLGALQALLNCFNYLFTEPST